MIRSSRREEVPISPLICVCVCDYRNKILYLSFSNSYFFCCYILEVSYHLPILAEGSAHISTYERSSLNLETTRKEKKEQQKYIKLNL